MDTNNVCPRIPATTNSDKFENAKVEDMEAVNNLMFFSKFKEKQTYEQEIKTKEVNSREDENIYDSEGKQEYLRKDPEIDECEVAVIDFPYKQIWRIILDQSLMDML